MLKGLMQSKQLLVSDILRYAATAHPDREIVSRLVDEPIWRYDNRRLAVRVGQVANMLVRLGVKPGDRVTSLAWNTHRHLELFYAVPGMGAVLHTANPRFSEDQVVYTITHAQSEVLLYDRTFEELVTRLRPRIPNIKHFVMLSNAEGIAATSSAAASYEALLAAEAPAFDWPSFDENSGAFLCYTSGTTGNPKGALYSHRSIVLQGLAGGLDGALGFSAFDCVMPCQSLYHGVAWGLPFIAAINGCKFVLPCERFDGASLYELTEGEGVTFSGGVPTIWTMYLDHLERTNSRPSTLNRVIIGGSAVPRSMAEKFQSNYGVQVRQIWGLTETIALGVLATPSPALAAKGQDEVNDVIWTKQGRLQFGIELKIVDDAGVEQPHDGKSPGTVLVRGPWVVERYFGSDRDAVDENGWFDTGDIATIDELGFMKITDRKKDVIKSGGEWISSIDLENAAATFPGVKVAAAVGVYHPKWEERPILVIELHDGATVTRDEMLEHLRKTMPRWWLPEAIFFEAVPLTSTGKIDKKVLKERHYRSLAE